VHLALNQKPLEAIMNVKKQYEELAVFLEANKAKKVNTIMPQLIEMMQRKNNASGQSSTFVKDEDGNVVAVYCYYHKMWELVSKAEYGSKKGTATGLNTMCKQGVSMWTKQQRVKKQEEAAILNSVASGELAVENIAAKQEEIAEKSKLIEPRADGHGYESADEAMFDAPAVDTAIAEEPEADVNADLVSDDMDKDNI